MKIESPHQSSEPALLSKFVDDLLPRSQIILPGESAGHYNRIEHQFILNINPTDIFERLWIRDLADLVWESLRLRRFRGDLIYASTPKGLRKILVGMAGPYDIESFVWKWSIGDQHNRYLVEDYLRKMNVSMDAVRAEALAAILPDLERIDRLIASTDSRRTMALREIGRHRDALATMLARVATKIEDAEFAEIESIDRQEPIQNGQPS